MKTLVIVESPHKAESIQKYLGKDYVVLASKGYITDLAKGGRFGLGVDVDNDFRPHYVLMEDKLETLDALLQATKKVDQILIASDPDREGEAIAKHVQEILDTKILEKTNKTKNRVSGLSLRTLCGGGSGERRRRLRSARRGRRPQAPDQ